MLGTTSNATDLGEAGNLSTKFGMTMAHGRCTIAFCLITMQYLPSKYSIIIRL